MSPSTSFAAPARRLCSTGGVVFRSSARAALAAVLGAGLGLLFAGCAGEPRFAEGNNGPAMNAYAEADGLTPEAPPPPPFELPPYRPLPTPPEPPQAEVARVPAGWNVPGRNRAWQYIVIHHSATPEGSVTEFNKLHRAQGWDEMGYHFLIGNGSGTPDGAVEVGGRWLKQKHGAHAKTPDNRFNDFGIGICLVGNFENSQPSRKQMQSLATLVAFLMQKYDLPASVVIGHQDATHRTACPGRNLETQIAGVRQLAARAVANGYAADPAVTASAH